MVELEYLFKKLEIITPLGQKFLRNIEFLKSKDEINNEIIKLEKAIKAYENKKDTIENIKLKLMNIKDISGTTERLKSGYILDDIELFELKSFALTYEEIKKINPLDFLSFPTLNEVINILDPDGNRLSTFYIYDSYSHELSEIRKKRKKTDNEEEREQLYELEMQIEDEIREELSKKLRTYASDIEQGLRDIAELDFTIAKAYFTKKFNLTKPEISETYEIKGMFNPVIKEKLEEEHKEYQPVDITLKPGVTLITGANMTGKTVILKTIALLQNLFQYGFYIPAKSAKLYPVNKIFLISGDYQSLFSGLSSYAAEMLKINEILKYIKTDENALILLDELARNTNPHEGKLIVKGVIEILNNKKSISLITTHFNNVADKGIRKLRIKGIKKEKLTENINPENITEIIDYSLIEENEEIVPEEAITIARLLNIDKELLDTIERIKKEETFHE
ncbi:MULTISPECIES: DNA mismatch repair protein MutS [unclassified Marinitoga]|uniref:lysine 5,6-aminomutase reactivase ATPase KamC n=1 Tax=unclassified Marinitoga TaxID=2640159 RepID=UPI0009509ED9|nr:MULTISPECIES: DNA mismatch repair protein MutS [unclassified Marinitoga]APT75430.1 DNA mismatch repair protein MutS [Marinitoga sp. 1137]NUU97090.1 DNA mismatch repair protein MutS [Marinitoga sp. 1138]